MVSSMAEGEDQGALYRVELVTALADRLGLEEDVVDATVVALLDEITIRLARGEKVILRGFGVFEARKMQAALRRKPDTGETVAVGERLRPVFRASRPLKSRLNEPVPT